MTWTNPPATITGIRTALVACAAWTYGQDAVHYPEAPTGASAPFAVVSMDGRTARIDIYGALTVGQMQTLGETIAYQLLDQYRTTLSGIIVASEPAVSEVGELTDPMGAAGDTFLTVAVTFDTGLSL